MRSQLLTLTLLMLLAGTPAQAGDHDHGKSDGTGHRRAWCPHCGEACYPTVTKGKETKHCFETESKTICIPKVRFPWEKDYGAKGGKGGHGIGKVGHGKDGCDRCPDVNCGTPKCGRTKHVNVLIKHEYECTVCKYSWDPSSYKGGTKKDSQNLDAPQPAATAPTVPGPPAVEVRRQPAVDNLQPARVESRRNDARSRVSTSRNRPTGIFSSFVE